MKEYLWICKTTTGNEYNVLAFCKEYAEGLCELYYCKDGEKVVEITKKA
jgi:hypothetical protein